MNSTVGRRSPPEVFFDALDALGWATVVLTGVLVGGLVLALTSPLTQDPYPLRFGLATVAVAGLGLLLRYILPALRRRRRRASAQAAGGPSTRPAAAPPVQPGRQAAQADTKSQGGSLRDAAGARAGASATRPANCSRPAWPAHVDLPPVTGPARQANHLVPCADPSQLASDPAKICQASADLAARLSTR